MRAALLLLVLALVASGCVANTADAPFDEAPSVIVPVEGEPVVQDHDHANRLEHMDAHNLRLVAHVKPWGDGSAYGQGTVNELAVNGHHVYVSRSNPEGGFAIVDVSDPRNPKVVGDFRSEEGADIEVASDGNVVLLMSQRSLPGEQSQDNPEARTPRGIYVVDTSDKTRPTLSSFFPLPANGPHTAHYHRAGPDLEIVAIQTYDFVPNPVTGSIDELLPLTQRVVLTELVRTEQGARLEVRGHYQMLGLPSGSLRYFPHDAFIEDHPITGQRLMYVAYWDAGMRIVDISDLAQPREIAAHTDFLPSALIQMHDVRTFPAPIAGMHVTAAAPEIVTAPETGQVTFLDTTDPTAPKKLGHWSLPGGLAVDSPFILSPHVFDTDAHGRLVIGHMHAGVWLLDASDPSEPVAMGYYFPHEERIGYSGPQPSVWGARFFNGLIVATDVGTGLYFLEPAGDLLAGAPPGQPGRGGLWPQVPDLADIISGFAS